MINSHLKKLLDERTAPAGQPLQDDGGILGLGLMDPSGFTAPFDPADSPAVLNPQQAAQAEARKEAIAAMVAKLAEGLAQSIVSAFDLVQRQASEESERANSTLWQKLESLESTIDNQADIWGPVEELISAVTEQRKTSAATIEQFGHLSQTVDSLREADARRTGELELLRNENRETLGKVSACSEELAGLKLAFEGTSRQVASIGQNLNRLDNVLAELAEVEAQRANAIETAFRSMIRTRSAAAA